MNTNKTPTLRWQGQLQVDHQRGLQWYIGAALTVIALIAFSVVTASWSFLAVIIIASIVYAFVHHKTLPPTLVTLSQTGIQCGQTYVAWKDCQYFWMLTYPDHNELHVKIGSRWKDDLCVQTADMDLEVIRGFVQRYVPENADHHEKILDFIARLLKI